MGRVALSRFLPPDPPPPPSLLSSPGAGLWFGSFRGGPTRLLASQIDPTIGFMGLNSLSLVKVPPELLNPNPQLSTAGRQLSPPAQDREMTAGCQLSTARNFRLLTVNFPVQDRGMTAGRQLSSALNFRLLTVNFRLLTVNFARAGSGYASGTGCGRPRVSSR